MIKQKDIDWVDSWELRSFEQVHPSHRTAVIELSKLLELKKELKEEVDRISLDETTYAVGCSDDGNIMFKKTDIEGQGDWTQEQWNEKIKDFTPRYVDYKELLEIINRVFSVEGE